MRGRIFTSDHRIFDLPALLRWNVTYTGGVPCDSFSVTCVYDRSMAEPLHLAAGFLALDEADRLLLRGIVDEYAAELTADGLTATIRGRGYAADDRGERTRQLYPEQCGYVHDRAFEGA